MTIPIPTDAVAEQDGQRFFFVDIETTGLEADLGVIIGGAVPYNNIILINQSKLWVYNADTHF